MGRDSVAPTFPIETKIGDITIVGTVMDVGHLKIPKAPKFNFNYDMPVFCYVLVKQDTTPENGKEYIAVCINMKIHARGTTPKKALAHMNFKVFMRVFILFRDNNDAAWEKILNTWQPGEDTDKLWNAYNKMQIECAKEGYSALDEHSVLRKQISTLQKKVKSLEAEYTTSSSNLEVSPSVEIPTLVSILKEDLFPFMVTSRLKYFPPQSEDEDYSIERAEKISLGETGLGEHAGKLVDLVTEYGTIFRIGKVKVPKIPGLFEYEIPVFCFVVAKCNDKHIGDWEGGKYVATCINLQISGYGKNPKEAQNEMAMLVGEYIYSLFKTYNSNPKIAWDNIFSLWRSNAESNDLWDKYNVIQIELAKQGIITDITYDTLNDKIEKLNKKIEELTDTAEEREERIDELYNRVKVLEKHIFDWNKVAPLMVLETQNISQDKVA